MYLDYFAIPGTNRENLNFSAHLPFAENIKQPFKITFRQTTLVLMVSKLLGWEN